MRKYIGESIEKFKKDAFSKVIYDVLRGLIVFMLLSAATRWLPEDFSVSKLLSTAFGVTVYGIVLFTLTIVILTIFAVGVFYRRKYKALEKDNFTDELTGLKNYKALEAYLDKTLVEIGSNSKNLSFILIDIDGFKKINDTIGYGEADMILKAVGRLLGNDKRVSDEVFRYFSRGDEFLLVAKDTSLTDAFRAAERKRQLIANTGFVVNTNTYHLTVCCGVIEYMRGKDNKESLKKKVAEALRLAKNQDGKNCSKSIV